MVLNKIKSEALAKIKRYIKNMEQRAVKMRGRGRGSGEKYIFHARPFLHNEYARDMCRCTGCMSIYADICFSFQISCLLLHGLSQQNKSCVLTSPDFRNNVFSLL